MKKKYIVMLSLIFLLIPTYIVISFLIDGSSTPVNIRSLKKVELITPNGAEYSFEEGDPEGMLSLFQKMLVDKSAVSVPAKGTDESRPFKVNYVTDLYNTKYDFILGSDPSKCYIRQREGVRVFYYKITPAHVEEFLASPYSESVYVSSEIPSLKIGGNFTGVTAVSWNYKTVNGETAKAKEYKLSSDKITIGAVASDFSCVFSKAPDDFEVEIYRDDTGELLYKGAVSGIQNISSAENYSVKIVINAVWNETETREYSGEVTYVAYAKLHAPSYFYLSEPQVKEGELVVVSAKNVIDFSSLKLSCEKLGFEPVFFKDGDYYRAYVPIPLGITDTLDQNRPILEFSISADESKDTLSLLVLDRDDGAKTVYNIETTSFNDIQLNAFPGEDPYSQLYSKISASIKYNTNFSTNYLKGRFLEGYTGTATRSTFGTHIKFSSSSSAPIYRSYDRHYVGAASNGIAAVNAGVVVYKGEFDYTGGLVVVDHGYGLLSWYWNIGQYAEGLEVGTELDRGDLVGYNGGRGLTEVIGGNRVSVHIGVTVFGTPIDIEPLIREGVLISDK